MTTSTPHHPMGWLPNVLTIGRIFSIPFFVAGIIGLSRNSDIWLAAPAVVLAIFILSAFTDYLDGFLARKWKVESDFGRMIDPIADKLFVAGGLIALSISVSGAWTILIPALAIIGRDILVAGAREHAALSGRAMPPTNLAKWKTACEMLGIAVLIVWLGVRAVSAADLPHPSFADHSYIVGTALIWLAAALSVYTGSLYFRAALAK
ncbi:MAG: CDP-diacylglycerol--glycerol-3-phosphate 3-phosphatidyltransferase [Maricaulaceae bacterium]